MDEYKKPYLPLFNAVTDALNALEDRNYGLAADFLRSAQREAEERFIQQEQPGPN